MKGLPSGDQQSAIASMTNERNALKAGLFILLTIAAIIAIIIGIKGVGRFLEPMQYATVSFNLGDDIGGLSPGDEVRIGGAKVGVVRRVELTDIPDTQHHIVVNFTIPKRFVLHKDARVSIQSQVTGTSVLNISSLGTGAPLAAGESLTGRPAPLTALLETGPEIKGLVTDIRNVTVPKVNNAIDKTADAIAVYRETGQTATSFITHVRGKVDPVVDRYYGMADSAKSALQQVSDLFGDTKPDIRTTIANLRDVTGTVRERLPALVDQTDGFLTRINKAVDNTNQALEDVKQIAVNTKDVTESARTVLVTNRCRIDAMIASLKTTGENLKNASAEVRRSPWRLLYQPKAGEMDNLNLYDTARQFADGANKLNDAASALRDALKDPKTDQAQVEKLVEKLDKSFASFNEVENDLWQQVKE
jgi:ABC-type transporter Mla subunit MlaD